MASAQEPLPNMQEFVIGRILTNDEILRAIVEVVQVDVMDVSRLRKALAQSFLSNAAVDEMIRLAYRLEESHAGLPLLQRRLCQGLIRAEYTG